jgi:hypothetical protein
MQRTILALAVILLLSACGVSGTIPIQGSSAPALIVWMFYGLGGSATSPGIDQVAQQAAGVTGIQVRGPFFWDSWQSIEADISGAPATARKALLGYSCGNESVTAIPAAMPAVTFAAVVGVQASTYCPPVALTPNILMAQETYNADCAETFGLGCALYQPGPGFPASRLTIINRPDSHGEADLDPDWQKDALNELKSAMSPSFKAKAPGDKVRFLVLHHHERAR